MKIFIKLKGNWILVRQDERGFGEQICFFCFLDRGLVKFKDLEFRGLVRGNINWSISVLRGEFYNLCIDDQMRLIYIVVFCLEGILIKFINEFIVDFFIRKFYFYEFSIK